MTEPQYAGSNPTRMGTTAKKENENYIINGHKWFTSSFDGANFAIVMVVLILMERMYIKKLVK